jgi:hypothetical protein
MNSIQETTEDPLEAIHNAIIQSERYWEEDECSANFRHRLWLAWSVAGSGREIRLVGGGP